MTQTSPTTGLGTAPGGGGTELPLIRSLEEAQKIDTDHPALKRALASLDDPDGIISAFQSFVS
jgi:hypothetical protein